MTEISLNQAELEQRRPPETRYLGITVAVWVQIAILGVLFSATFFICLRRLWEKTNPFTGEPNWSHAICVPVIGLYYLYANRQKLLSTPVVTAMLGLPLAIAGLLLFAYGIYPGQNDVLKDVGMVITLFGMVTYLTGWQMMRVLWFPIVFLICAIPWPPLVYSQVALPLQELAAKVAVSVLKMSDVNAFFSGTKIFMEDYTGQLRTLNVAEACAGMRSLMTFITIGAAMAFLSSRPLWQKLLMTVSAIPIAIFCNVMRVSGQGLLDHYWSREWSQGFAHQFAGMVMLIPAFFLLLMIGWLLDKIFVEETRMSNMIEGPLSADAVAKLTAEAAAAGTPLVVPPQRSHTSIRRSKPLYPGKKASGVAPTADVAKAWEKADAGASEDRESQGPASSEVKP